MGVALVTGSSRGLGAVIAQQLAQDGLAVAVNGRRGDEQVGEVGHGFTDEAATRHMHSQFAESSIDRRHMLTDSAGTAQETAQEILRRTRAGILRYP